MKFYSNLYGFGLIEILISIFIVAFGVLAVGKLQTTTIFSSNENRSRIEALEIAQSRIEEIRNFFNELDGSNKRLDDASFISSYIANLNNTDPSDYAGVSYIYSISDSAVVIDNLAEISVVVSWLDSSNSTQNVSLTTSITFTDAASFGTKSNKYDFDYVESPTGRAKIGAGEISSKDLTGKEFTRDGVNDGTEVYRDTGENSNNLLLAVGDDVVLTLEEACISPGNESDDTIADTDCVDFVQISGRVYFEPTYSIGNGANTYSISATASECDGCVNPKLLANDFFVLASDAAYCARYSGDTVIFSKNEGDLVYIDQLSYDDLDSDEVQDSDEYFYFNYTCYLGGGWNGNIGLLSTVIANAETPINACVGDPNSLTNVITGYTPESSRRRSYRGMVWKYNESSSGPVLDKTYGTDSTIPLYYSWGIADATVIDRSQTYKHDFLVVDDNDDCKNSAIMLSALFTNNVDDFFCLNKTMDGALGLPYPYSYNQGTGEITGIGADSTNLDDRDLNRDRDSTYENEGKVGYFNYCEYDPTKRPYFVHDGAGTISITGFDSTFNSSNVLEENIFIKTSQGDSCTVKDFSFNLSDSTFIAEYLCLLYDEGTLPGDDKNAPAGVSGSVWLYDILSSDVADLTCISNTFDFSNSEGWSTGFDFNCVGSQSVCLNNGCPVAVKDSFNATKDVLKEINVSNILANDIASDGLLTFVGVSSVGCDLANGAKSTCIEYNLNASGEIISINYTYRNNIPGNVSSIKDTLQYTIREGDGDEASGQIEITVGK